MLIALRVLMRLGKRMFLKAAANTLGQAIGQAGLSNTPATLTLEPGGEAALAAEPRLARWTQELAAEGFVDAGAYTALEMPGVAMRLLTSPDEGFAAVLYVHPRAGTWCDVVVRYVDGTSRTWLNRAPSGLDPRPGHEKVSQEGASAAELLRAARAGLQRKLRKPFEPESVARDFMDAYAQEIAWRRGKGVRPEEVARIAAASGSRRR